MRRHEITDTSAFKGEPQQVLEQMLTDTYHGDVTVLVVWAADRLCRGGTEKLLRMICEAHERGVRLVSFQEPCREGTDASAELLAAIAA